MLFFTTYFYNFFIFFEEVHMNKEKINAIDLIMIANSVLQGHQNYFEGVRVHFVKEVDGALLFQGESFLDSNGFPTPQSQVAFNLYKYLSHELSPKFTLDE